MYRIYTTSVLVLLFEGVITGMTAQHHEQLASLQGNSLQVGRHRVGYDVIAHYPCTHDSNPWKDVICAVGLFDVCTRSIVSAAAEDPRGSPSYVRR